MEVRLTTLFLLATTARLITGFGSDLHGEVDWPYVDFRENSTGEAAAPDNVTSREGGVTSREGGVTSRGDGVTPPTIASSAERPTTRTDDCSARHSAGPGSVTSGRRLSDEETLLEYIFCGYNPSARPVINSSDTVNVQMQFSLIHIKDLDIRSQIFTATGLLIMDWTDERLTWNSEEHNDMKDIAIEARSLWTPEFAVINGAEKIYEDYSQFRVIVSYNGLVHWEPGGVFKTICQIDVTNYPFDSQKCHMIFGAWSYHTAKMNLTYTSVNINVDSYIYNGEWQIVNTSVERKEFNYDSAPDDRFANIDFMIYIRRRHTFYIVNVILPSIMTSVLLLSIFFCTPAQKVQIGVVVLLSFRIFLLNVAGNIPKTSDHIPLLVIYLTCTMAITTLSMVLTVFVLNLHHVSDYPVPGWMRRLVLGYLARVLCMRAPSQQPRAATCARRWRRNAKTKTADCEEHAAILELTNLSTAAAGADGERRQRAGPEHANFYFASESDYDEPPVDYSKDWRVLADIVDRLFFWCFLTAIVITTLVLFHPLMPKAG